ncbi:UNVERIFIED_CONTAM: hypothetical protein GTU68_009749 [Idotea baltica]|nr:hypothetical protein [Idotea baltica]
MSKQKNTRLVYSTDQGRLCPQKDRPAAAGDGIVRLRRETKGRGGKAVTVISGVPLAEAELKKLAKSLKQKCGVGGAIKDADIEIQGDQRELLQQTLENLGYTVKQAGG